MLTIMGKHSDMKLYVTSLLRFIGIDRTTTVLLCMCERCGYGRADHPKTVRKPWVAMARPQCCKACGSPYWDVPARKARVPLNSASATLAKSTIRRHAEVPVSQ